MKKIIENTCIWLINFYIKKTESEPDDKGWVHVTVKRRKWHPAYWTVCILMIPYRYFWPFDGKTI